MDRIIIRYGEIGLKKQNRIYFEKLLASNIRDCLKKNSIVFDKINRFRGRVVVLTEQDCSILSDVFGIVSFSPAIEVKADIEEFKKTALELALAKGLDESKTFRVSAKRLNKKFGMESLKINEEVGGFIWEKTHGKVELVKPEIKIGIEIIDDRAFVFSDSSYGHGGLPIGSEGRVIALLENHNSILAALLMMKRGCIVQPAAFEDFNIDLLKKYAYGQSIELKILKNISELRSFAEMKKIDSVAVGQTLDDFKNLDCSLVVFRPLVGMNEEEIKKEFEKFK